MSWYVSQRWRGAGMGVVALVLSVFVLVPGQRAAAAQDEARVVAETWVDERTLDLTIDSPAMGRPEMVRLLLPTGWSKTADRNWPQLWLLHGAFDSYVSWTARTDVADLVDDQDVIVVMPDAGACGWYSDWWNGGRGGPPRWETFHLSELRQIVERDYGGSDSRAVAGLSMGGFGAMSYAGRHPGMFRAAASFSGATNTRYMGWLGAAPPAVTYGSVVLGCPGANPLDLWGSRVLNDGIWRAHNPYDLAEHLRGTPLYVSSGDGRAGPYEALPATVDLVEAMSRAVNQSFADRLAELGIPATIHFYAGTHNWPYWQRELHAAFPMLMSALEGETVVSAS